MIPARASFSSVSMSGILGTNTPGMSAYMQSAASQFNVSI